MRTMAVSRSPPASWRAKRMSSSLQSGKSSFTVYSFPPYLSRRCAISSPSSAGKNRQPAAFGRGGSSTATDLARQSRGTGRVGFGSQRGGGSGEHHHGHVLVGIQSTLATRETACRVKKGGESGNPGAPSSAKSRPSRVKGARTPHIPFTDGESCFYSFFSRLLAGE